MITVYDRASLAKVRDTQLHALIERHFGSLGEWTECLVIQPGDTEDDIIREVGFSPLVEPIHGARFGGKGFTPFWDHLTDHGGWFELSISFGSSFAYVLYIEDAHGVLPALRFLCRVHAS